MKQDKKIYFHTEDIQFTLRNKLLLRNWLITVARKHKKTIDTINYIFVSDEYLYKMNVQFLNHKSLTDIITFQYSDTDSKQISGDIYISIDRVRDNASIFKTGFTNELHRVLSHGLLHLCGYKDKTPQEEKRMRILEEKALDLLK
ncbi:MAG: rRNA maturation RNase YbeY [Bacteroidia bacterium]